MRTSALDVATCADGTVVVRLHGDLRQEAAIEFRQVLVHTVRKVRPIRLVLDLVEVSSLDSIKSGNRCRRVPVG
jgi:anti-anti-sigma regulatory factor